MATVAENEKKINEWVVAMNKHIGEEWVPWPKMYPVQSRNIFGQQAISLVTEDIIGIYAAALGERNLLFWSNDYARRTKWGGIIAPPCFTDSIAISWINQLEPRPLPWHFATQPAGNQRQLFGVFRPGDQIHLIEKYLGLEERKAKEPRPYRLFFDNYEKSFINQRDQVLAKVHYRYARLVTATDPASQPVEFRGDLKQKRYHFSQEELDVVIKGYMANKRRGAEVLFWEDVPVGLDIPTLSVGPSTSTDSVAFHSAQQGHILGFELGYERALTETFGTPGPDPETGSIMATHYVHVGDGPGYGLAFLLGYQMEGLLARMLTDWIGDDGFVKMLDCRFRELPIMGHIFHQKGKVTGKRVVDGEHLVDLDVRTDNQAGAPVVTGTTTVRLMSKGG